MSRLDTNAIRHTAGSADNLTLDNSQNVTVEGNLTVDGTTVFTGDCSLPNDTVDIADLSATGTASASTFLCGNNTWAAAGGGKVLQAVTANTRTVDSNTDHSTWEDTNLTCDITIASGSKVLVLIMQPMMMKSTTRDYCETTVRALRDSTVLNETYLDSEGYGRATGIYIGTGSGQAHNPTQIWHIVTINVLDDTSGLGAGTLTYKTQHRPYGTAAAITSTAQQEAYNDNGSASHITLLEIGS